MRTYVRRQKNALIYKFSLAKCFIWLAFCARALIFMRPKDINYVYTCLAHTHTIALSSSQMMEFCLLVSQFPCSPVTVAFEFYLINALELIKIAFEPLTHFTVTGKNIGTFFGFRNTWKYSIAILHYCVRWRVVCAAIISFRRNIRKF